MCFTVVGKAVKGMQNDGHNARSLYAFVGFFSTRDSLFKKYFRQKKNVHNNFNPQHPTPPNKKKERLEGK